MLKYALLGILAERPRHGYELKADFETAFGGTWPLNIGQVYVTLGRLERDALVRCEVVEQTALPDRKVYELTDLGEKELREWLDLPARLAPPLRDELFVKVFVQRRLGSASGVASTLAAARTDVLTALRALVERRDAEPTGSTTALLLDAAIGQLDATTRWLDRAEA